MVGLQEIATAKGGVILISLESMVQLVEFS